MRVTVSVAALVLTLLPHTLSQSPLSPCPNVLTYEQPEDNRWYATIQLSTDVTLHGVWVDVLLDGKADSLGNWFGKVTTQDNTEYRLENKAHKLEPGPSYGVRFYVQHNTSQHVPRVRTIRLNGREICQQHRTTSRATIQAPAQTRAPQPVYVQREETSLPSPRPYSIGDLEVNDRQANRGTTATRRPLVTPSRPSFNTVRKQVEDDNDYAETSPGNEDDYFQGDLNPTYNNHKVKDQPKGSRPSNSNNQCGTVATPAAPLVVGGQPTVAGQWPWHIAIYHAQTVDSKYICGGTLVSLKHVITAAHCVTRKGPGQRLVNKRTLTIYLGKHNLRTSSDGVQIKFVESITIHPDYNVTNYFRDVAVLRLNSPVDVTTYVRPACLWPEDQTELDDIVGRLGSVVGWGYDEDGQVTEELLLAKMPVVKQQTCLWSNSDFFARYTSEYTYCAGFLNGTSVCNGDSGGGMVFNLGSERQPTWHLRGLVSLSAAKQNDHRCDPTHYVIFTDIAKYLRWLKEVMTS